MSRTIRHNVLLGTRCTMCLVDEVNYPAGGKMQIFAKLNLSIAQTKIRFGISDLDYFGIHYF